MQNLFAMKIAFLLKFFGIRLSSTRRRLLAAWSWRKGITAAASTAILVLSVDVLAQVDPIDFGDDSSEWAYDGECDDPRFEGVGAAQTLLEEDRRRDATDCRRLFADGRIALRDDDSGDLDFGDDSSQWAHDGECDDPRFTGEGMAYMPVASDTYHDATDCRTLLNQGLLTLAAVQSAPANASRIERGRLEEGDETLPSGTYADTYTFDGVRGGRAVIDLRAGDFDPYLIVLTPDGQRFENDDYEGDLSRSVLSLSLMETGSYHVTVTSYSEGESGGYTVDIAQDDVAPLEEPRWERRGTLLRGDETLQGGEYVDSYEFEGSVNEHVRIQLRSEDFDTYLILVDPSGRQTENDDAADLSDRGHSALDIDLSEMGTYRILVTSYSVGETGDYRLSVDRSGSAIATEPAHLRDTVHLQVGEMLSGRLEDGDTQIDGSYHDFYAFDGTSGETVRLELTSSEFDTYLVLTTPSGERIENDDLNGDIQRSALELNLSESGRFRVAATSYAASQTGAYELALLRRRVVEPVIPTTGGRIYGIFAGISDYPDDQLSWRDLDYTADDAVRIRDALVRGASMRPEDGVVLVDSQATTDNLRDAIGDISARIGPDDTFVLFYSGHGGRVDRPDSTPTDPDGVDETIALYDREITDDELAEMLAEVEAKTTLVLLDSCFSGGFAKDVISVPGRMGIFSSEEDVPSLVAYKFEAGGFLSAFLTDGIADGLADANKDRQLTAIELSMYLTERFRSDVKARADEYVRSGGPQGHYQQLVIDRGSIGPYDVLFEH